MNSRLDRSRYFNDVKVLDKDYMDELLKHKRILYFLLRDCGVSNTSLYSEKIDSNIMDQLHTLRNNFENIIIQSIISCFKKEGKYKELQKIFDRYIRTNGEGNTNKEHPKSMDIVIDRILSAKGMIPLHVEIEYIRLNIPENKVNKIIFDSIKIPTEFNKILAQKISSHEKELTGKEYIEIQTISLLFKLLHILNIICFWNDKKDFTSKSFIELSGKNIQ